MSPLGAWLLACALALALTGAPVLYRRLRARGKRYVGRAA